MIKLEGISKTFNKGSANENQLLNDFNLTIEANVFTLIGFLNYLGTFRAASTEKWIGRTFIG